MQQSIQSRVYKVIAEVQRGEEAKLTPEMKLKEDLGFASLDLMMLMMALEEEFKGSITDQEASDLTSVGEIVSFVEKKFAAVNEGLL